MLVSARALQGAFGAILAPAALGTLVSTFRGPARAGPGLCCLRVGRRRRRCGGPDPGRPAHPVPVLALHPVRQPDLRCHRRGRRPGLHPQQPRGHPAADGLARGRTGLRRAVPYRLRLLPRRDGRLDSHADPRQPGLRRGPARRVRRRRASGSRHPLLPLRRDTRPHPGRLLCGRRHHRNRDLRHLPVPHLLHAAGQGIQPADHGAALPADGRRHPGRLHALQRGGAAPDRAARPDRRRHAVWPPAGRPTWPSSP